MTELPKIKICGITRPEDAVLSAESGAFFIGLIFCSSSRRAVTVAQARKVIAAIEGLRVLKVGVFMDSVKSEVIDIAGQLGLDLLQLHGEESPEYCASMPLPIIKSFAVGPEFDARYTADYLPSVRYVLFDTADGRRKGGTGMSFNWKQLEPWRGANPGIEFFLAGGLGPENIRQAAEIRPFALDVNSGIESAPGVKDPRLMGRLFGALYAS